MPTSRGQFVWHELMTTDVKASLAFYGKLVGWSAQPMPMAGGETYYVLEASGRGLGGMLEISKAQREAGMRSGWIGYISSPDVDADVKRLQKAGATVHQPAAEIPNVGRFAP